MGPRLKNTLVLLVKLAVTGALLAWVVSGVRWHDHVVTPDGQSWRVLDSQGRRLRVLAPAGPAWHDPADFVAIEGQLVRPGITNILHRLHPGPCLLAAVLFAAQLTLMGIRWWCLLRWQALAVPLGPAVRLMFVGHFFNFFLPGSTGGDVVRAVLVTRRTSARTVAVATVLLDRFVGLAGMAALAGAMTLATWGRPQTQRAALAVAVTLAILAAAGLVLFSRRVQRALRIGALLDRLPQSQNLHLALDTLRALPRAPATAATVTGMTLAVHLLLAGAVASLGAALDLPVPVGLYFLFVPVIYILAAVPVSIGGLGVVEGMYLVFFASSPGVDASAVVAMSLLARLGPMLLSLAGLVFWLSERGARRATPANPGETT